MFNGTNSLYIKSQILPWSLARKSREPHSGIGLNPNCFDIRPDFQLHNDVLFGVQNFVLDFSVFLDNFQDLQFSQDAMKGVYLISESGLSFPPPWKLASISLNRRVRNFAATIRSIAQIITSVSSKNKTKWVEFARPCPLPASQGYARTKPQSSSFAEFLC